MLISDVRSIGNINFNWLTAKNKDWFLEERQLSKKYCLMKDKLD